jgi:hypothetical protein
VCRLLSPPSTIFVAVVIAAIICGPTHVAAPPPLWITNTPVTGAVQAYTSVVDVSFFYLGTFSAPALVCRMNPADFTLVGSCLSLPVNYLQASAIDEDAGYAYFLSHYSGAKVCKIALAFFELVGCIAAVPSSYGYFAAATIDPSLGRLYIGINDPTGAVCSVALTPTFTFLGCIDTPARYDGALLDPRPGRGFLYMAGFLCCGNQGYVSKVRATGGPGPSGLEHVTTLTIPGAARLGAAAIDLTNDVVYVSGIHGGPGILCKLSVAHPSFALIGSCVNLGGTSEFRGAGIYGPPTGAGRYLYLWKHNPPESVVCRSARIHQRWSNPVWPPRAPDLSPQESSTRTTVTRTSARGRVRPPASSSASTVCTARGRTTTSPAPRPRPATTSSATSPPRRLLATPATTPPPPGRPAAHRAPLAPAPTA